MKVLGDSRMVAKLRPAVLVRTIPIVARTTVGRMKRYMNAFLRGATTIEIVRYICGLCDKILPREFLVFSPTPSATSQRFATILLTRPKVLRTQTES